jgi:hypothetical protein
MDDHVDAVGDDPAAVRCSGAPVARNPPRLQLLPKFIRQGTQMRGGGAGRQNVKVGDGRSATNIPNADVPGLLLVEDTGECFG